MKRLIPIIFPICMVWLCAWLQQNIISYTDDWLWSSRQIGFLETPYGIALIVTIIIVELALISLCYDW